MKYFVYILQSKQSGRYYIGHTEDLTTRLQKHNSGRVRSTKGGRPWIIIRTEDYPSRSEAYRRELEIKGYKGGVQFKALLDA